MPQSRAHEVFMGWEKIWGGIILVKLFGQSTIIVNSFEAATTMLDKKSAIYSDRPILAVAGEMVGLKNSLVCYPNGSRLRDARAMLHRFIGTRASMKQYHPTIEAEMHRLLRRILERPSPDDVQKHIRLTVGATIMMIAHGYSANEENDPYIDIAEVWNRGFAEVMEPGAFWADTFPILLHVPSWFPGTSWKERAKAVSIAFSNLADIPHQFVKEQMERGIAVPSFTSAHLEQEGLSPEKEILIKYVASSIMGAGADTTVGVVSAFFLAMTLYPDVQRRAQAELDAVVGNDRLPSFEDRERLPYLDALVKEVLRWNPILPQGVAHCTTEDDVQDGYFIPKGAVIVPNIWKFCRDEERYKNAMDFIPERFIASESKEAELDPLTFVFGFGRRICPGIQMALAQVFMACAMSLSVFDITKAIKDGKQMEPLQDFAGSMIRLAVFTILFCGINPGRMTAEQRHYFAGPWNHFWKCLERSGLTSRLLPASEDYTLPRLFNLGLVRLSLSFSPRELTTAHPDQPRTATVLRVQLTAGEMASSVPTLLAKIRRLRPRVVCFVGKLMWGNVARVLKKVAVAPPGADQATSSSRSASPATRGKGKGKGRKGRKGKKDKNEGYGLQPLKVVHDAAEDGAVRETLFFVVPSSSPRVVSHQLDDKVELFALLKEQVDQAKRGVLDTSYMSVVPLASE
ncbi:hypothetical protein EWM64_g3308 [Hericium alpestre]|uniref:Uracil-DNA glycosylase-like domain-containing protein n=1 Tax=Hericium alpestre TaxID=135208 RepID=A0A4Z0A315_9AGAM|nr:hypothetical protein EWM64_g3308 [Hericium alpestre]